MKNRKKMTMKASSMTCQWHWLSQRRYRWDHPDVLIAGQRRPLHLLHFGVTHCGTDRQDLVAADWVHPDDADRGD